MADATPTTTLTRAVEWRDFLTKYPPGTRGSVEGAIDQSDGTPRIATPELRLHCDNCRAVCFCTGSVRGQGQQFPGPDAYQFRDAILWYVFQSCRIPVKTIAVRALGDENALRSHHVDLAKMGEWPRFTFETPARVTALLGPHADLYLKGRQAEADGLGLGAFIYYRRVVEDQKNALLNAIITVAERTRAPAEAIETLKAAIRDHQFSAAMKTIKDVVPRSLYLQGENPMTLLHRALSGDIHNGTDEQCLNAAHDIRTILFAFAGRLDEAMKDERELSESIARSKARN